MGLSSGQIHVHTEFSLNDAPATITELCERASALGCPAMAITDHGNCAGWVEFRNTAGKYGIKPVFGVEGFLETEWHPNAHILLLAETDAGRISISRAVSLAAANARKVGGILQPVLTREILESTCKSGGVIATTACIGGVAATVFFANDPIQKAMERRGRLRDKYMDADDPAYAADCAKEAEIDAEIKALREERNALDKVAKRPFRKLEIGLAAVKETDSSVYAERLHAYQRMKAETEAAIARVDEIRRRLDALRSKRTSVHRRIAKFREQMERRDAHTAEIERLSATLHTEADIARGMREALSWMRATFGEGNVFVEVQNHGLEKEAAYYPAAAALAREMGLPLVATNDVHLATADQAKARQAMLSLRFERWHEPGPDDAEYYMKTDAELEKALLEILPKDVVREAMANISAILGRCNAGLGGGLHAPRFRDESGRELSDREAEGLLREHALAGFAGRFPNGAPDGYRARLEMELSTITGMGFAHYFLNVEDYVAYARRRHPFGVGPGRGSVAGSLVAYCLGITMLDPVKYGLFFERFLNPARVSMPDIDVDFAEMARRDALLHVRGKYGEQQVARIRTVSRYMAKESIHSAARVIGFREYPKDRERYSDEEMTRLRAGIRKKGDAMADMLANGDTVAMRLPELLERFATPLEREIANTAARIEGRAKSFGTHAGGVIISDGKPLMDYVPLMRIVEDKGAKGVGAEGADEEIALAVACDMVEAEHDLGLLKMDFLGLNTLNVAIEAMAKVEDEHGVAVDANSLPFEDRVFREVFAAGATSCVFQFESDGMKRMLREARPACFEDIVLLVAAYRPGPMESIPEMLRVKNGGGEPDYAVPEMAPILGPTYGVPIYQEQLMSIFHECAGLSLGEADIIRKAMSKKKEDQFRQFRPQLIDGLVARGAARERAEAFWDSLLSFASYAFNKGHAAVYAYVSYVTAWLKLHYLPEYMAAVLNNPPSTGDLGRLVRAAKAAGLNVLCPDINGSGKGFTVEGRGVRYGIASIKGLRNDEAEAILGERERNGQYMGVLDFLRRTGLAPERAALLVDAGAFDRECSSRRACAAWCARAGAALAAKAAAMKALRKELDLACAPPARGRKDGGRATEVDLAAVRKWLGAKCPMEGEAAPKAIRDAASMMGAAAEGALSGIEAAYASERTLLLATDSGRGDDARDTWRMHSGKALAARDAAVKEFRRLAAAAAAARKKEAANAEALRERLSAAFGWLDEDCPLCGGEVPADVAEAVSHMREAARKALEAIGEAARALAEGMGAMTDQDNLHDRLSREQELLYAYVSAHPVDAYASAYRRGQPRLDDVRQGQGKYIGLVTDARIVRTKARNEEMAMFTLEDKLGSLRCVAFPSAYAKCGKLIRDGNVVCVEGAVEMSQRKEGQEVDEELSMKVKTLELCRPDRAKVLLAVPTMAFFEERIQPFLSRFEDEDGAPAYVCALCEGAAVEDTGKLYDPRRLTRASLPGLHVYRLHEGT